MKGSALASRPDVIICPLCEAGELLLFGSASIRCDSCARIVEGAVAEGLVQIASLPDALSRHACEECSHPEMRRLPDGVFLRLGGPSSRSRFYSHRRAERK